MVSAVAPRRAAERLRGLGFVLNCNRPHSGRSLRCRLPEVNTLPYSIYCMHIRSCTLHLQLCAFIHRALRQLLLLSTACRHNFLLCPSLFISLLSGSSAFIVLGVLCSLAQMCVCPAFHQCAVARSLHPLLSSSKLCFDGCGTMPVCNCLGSFGTFLLWGLRSVPLLNLALNTLGCPCNRVHIGMDSMYCGGCFLQGMRCNGNGDNLACYDVPAM